MIRQSEKHDQIVAAAVKRLSHFGIHKTTLAEIASDLGMSTQSLLYYFADKQALIKAAIEYITESYLESLSQHMAVAASFEQVLMQLVKIRYEYFSKYYMILCEIVSAESHKPLDLLQLKSYLAQREREILDSFFKKALDAREVKNNKAGTVIQLVQETLDAFAHAINRSHHIPEKGEMKQLMEKQKEVIQLMYNGIAA